jgi:hypothetical protein
MDYKPMIAKSGEVYYTINGNLQYCDSMSAFDEIIKRKELLETTYFELSVNGTHHKLLATRIQVITKLIGELPYDKMMSALRQYQEQLRGLGL